MFVSDNGEKTIDQIPPNWKQTYQLGQYRWM